MYDTVLKRANEIESVGLSKIPWSLNYQQTEFKDGLTGNFKRSKFVEYLGRVMVLSPLSGSSPPVINGEVIESNGYNKYGVGLEIKTKVCGGKGVAFSAVFNFIEVSINCMYYGASFQVLLTIYCYFYVCRITWLVCQQCHLL